LSTIAAVVLVVVCGVGLYVLSRRRRRKAPARSLYVTALEKLLGGGADEGFRDLKQEVTANPGNDRAYLLLGDLLRQRGEADRAARVHRQLLVRPGLDPQTQSEVRLHLAEDLEAAGRWEAAEAVYREALRSSDSSELARKGLATALEQQGKWEQALGVRQRLKDVPERVLALMLARMGEEELDRGRYKEARARFADALRKDRACSIARLLLGDSYRRQGKLDDAVGQWKSVLAHDDELAQEAFRRLEEALFDGGRFGEMEQIYRNALEGRPDDGGTVRALAGFLARKGEKREALDVCRTYLAQHPEDRQVRFKVAALSRDVGDTEDALENLFQLLPTEDALGSYECPICGHQAERLLWLCPSCKEWVVYRRAQ
jgi:lipopolysaccharide biosynthesis regulator YciM